jgi:hypothetical protein
MAITSFIAGEAISAGNAVYVTSSGYLYKAIATNQTQAAVVGLAVDTVIASGLTRVITDSIYSNSSSLTPGNFQYLSVATSGSVVSYATWQTELNATTLSGAFLTNIGRALSTASLAVEVQKPTYVTK